MTIQVKPLNQMDIIKLKPDLYVRFLRYGYYSENTNELIYELKIFYNDGISESGEIGKFVITFSFKDIEYNVYFNGDVANILNNYVREYYDIYFPTIYDDYYLMFEAIIALIEHINLVLQIEDEENKEDISQFLDIYLQLIPGVG